METSEPQLYVNLSEAELLDELDTDRKRPNLLVRCHEVDVSAVMKYLLKYCERPYHFIALPGSLTMPDLKRGTLFIANVAKLTIPQQIELNECISKGCENLRVVSLTTMAIEQLVSCGEFLEDLYYRLNVIRLDARLERRRTRRAHL